MVRKLMITIPVLFTVLFAQESSNTVAQSEDETSSAVTSESDNSSEKISDLEGKVNGLEESYLETKATVSKLAKLKLSGYIQAQWQYAETLGVQTSMAGSKFDKETDNRFFIRRGRIKFNYDNGLNQYVLQFDASSSGFEIKDAYLTLTEPWLKYFTATMGIFDRPFGYEISYSSSMRESPERSRVYQTLFPKEREIGAKLSFAGDKGFWSYINAKYGIFNGVTTLQLENDDNKDQIFRVGFEIPLRNAGMGIDGGFSGYIGKVTNTDTTTKGVSYEMDGKVFKKSTGQKGKDFDRQYLGFDLQYYLDIPVIGGLTLRGEYLWGVQPGTSSSSSFYQPSSGGTPNGAIYSRNFSGAYLYWVQCWGTQLQSVVKADYYDPNMDVEKNDIGVSGSGTGAADLAYLTGGVGLIYNWDENLKFMLYYDVPKNEKTSSLSDKKYAHDYKDNVFTLRVQYKF
jgi:phosphate-selective porin